MVTWGQSAGPLITIFVTDLAQNADRGPVKTDPNPPFGENGGQAPVTVIEAQMQGGIIDGLGAAFSGEVPIERGRATSRNFGDYRMIRMREAPQVIECHFLPSRLRPTGFGEPPLPPIAPAVANAIAALTGDRIRVMPFSKAGYVLG